MADETILIAEAPPFEGRHEPRQGDRMRIISRLLPATVITQPAIFTDDMWGALLMVQVVCDGRAHANGTGFMVMPGLVLTAAHVFDDFANHLQADQAQIHAFGRIGTTLYPWAVTRVHYAGDVALLEVSPLFEVPAEFELNHFELTARLPGPGEPVLGLGLISEKPDYAFPFEGVGAFTPIAAPGPVLQLEESAGFGRGVAVVCDFYGPHGMSGGPVFDREGRIFGLLSSAIGQNPDEPFTCWVLAPWPAFMQTIQPAWPPGYYHEGSLWPHHIHSAGSLSIGQSKRGEPTIAYSDAAPQPAV